MRYLILHYLYYDDYAIQSLRMIKLFAKSLSGKVDLLNVGCVSIKNDSLHLETLKTENEFQAWDRALDSIPCIDEYDIVIFANDTFSVHHEWTNHSAESFIKSLKKIHNQKKPSICGDVTYKDMQFKLFDKNTNCWVSTYFFAINAAALSFCSPLNVHNLIKSYDSPELIDFSKIANKNFNLLIDYWLSDKGGWYGKNKSTKKQLSYKKLRIFEEFYISAKINEKDGIFYPVNFKNDQSNILTRLWRLIYQGNFLFIKFYLKKKFDLLKNIIFS